MAKRGRKPKGPYVTQWSEVIHGVRQRIIERDQSGAPVVWHLYPTGRSVPYFGAVHKGDLAAERKAIGRFLHWKAEQEGTPWEQHDGNAAFVDATMAGMMHIHERDRGRRRAGDHAPTGAIQSIVDRRAAKLADAYAAKYRTFIRNLILTDPRKAAAELEIDQLAWLHDLKPPAPSLSLAEVGDTYFSRPLKGTDHWERKMRRMWNEFVCCVSAETCREVTVESINRFRDKVLEAHNRGKSPTYVAHRFGCVKTILNYAKSQVEHPDEFVRVLGLCAKLKPPRKRAVDPEPISPEHFRKLMEAVEDEPKWKAIFLLALNAALYPGEVAAVKRSHVNLEARTLVMTRGKTGVPRVAVLWQRSVQAIREYQSEEPHGSDYLFVSQTGAPYNANHISRNFCRRRDACELPEWVQFAHIRDGAFTAAFDADGVEEKHAKLLAGHHSGMSDHYVKRSPRVVAKACEAIETYYFEEGS